MLSVKPVDKTSTELVKVFRAEGVLTKSKKMLMLTDEELSSSLEFIFKKTTDEVIKFNDKKAVNKIGEMKDGVFFCKSRKDL